MSWLSNLYSFVLEFAWPVAEALKPLSQLQFQKAAQAALKRFSMRLSSAREYV
jgi:hypothetical protein